MAPCDSQSPTSGVPSPPCSYLTKMVNSPFNSCKGSFYLFICSFFKCKCLFIDVLCLDFEGKLADVVLGFDTIEPYQVS